MSKYQVIRLSKDDKYRKSDILENQNIDKFGNVGYKRLYNEKTADDCLTRVLHNLYR